MKKLMFLGLAVLGAVSAQAQYRYVEPSRPVGFVRLNLGAAIAGNGDVSSAPGGIGGGIIGSGDAAFTMGLEGGVMLGSDQEHEISFGFSGFGWSEGFPPTVGYPYYMEYTESFTPFMFGYAYNLGLGYERQFKIYAGPMAGFTIAEATESDGYSGGYWYWDNVWSQDSRVAFTWGAQAGVRWVFNRYFELSAGYRFLRINGGGLYTHDFQNVHQPDMDVHMILIMFGGRF